MCADDAITVSNEETRRRKVSNNQIKKSGALQIFE